MSESEAAKKAWKQVLAGYVTADAIDGMADDVARKSWLAQIESYAMQANVEARAGVGTKQHRIAELELALVQCVAQLTDANRTIAHYNSGVWFSQELVAEIGGGDAVAGSFRLNQAAVDLAAVAEAEAQRADEPVAMSDPPQSDPEAPPSRGVVDQVVDALDKRLVGRSDRVRLRGALDKADAPLTGRAAGDEALGRIARLGALQGDSRR